MVIYVIRRLKIFVFFFRLCVDQSLIVNQRNFRAKYLQNGEEN